MQWLIDLFTNDSVAHAVVVYSMVIAMGIGLGKVKVYGISLGITLVLFVGILIGHLGLSIHHLVLEFAKDFGLILFVYSIGLQVGTGFFSSLRYGGTRLNLLALTIIALHAGITILVHYLGNISMPVAVGIMSGAVTNTPGLGAAQETLNQLKATGLDTDIPDIGLGYAVAYPFGVMGIILSMILIKSVFRIHIDSEIDTFNKLKFPIEELPDQIFIEVTNPALYGRKIIDVVPELKMEVIFSRLYRKGEIIFPDKDTILMGGDIVLITSSRANHRALVRHIGKESALDVRTVPCKLMSKQVIVTRTKMAGQTLGSLRLRSNYGVNITRISRAGIEFVANPNLRLQIGDKLAVVGEEDHIDRVAGVLGNSLKRLNEPNLVPIFIGILLGVMLGSIPIVVPGIPIPIRLGLAGGPLIIAILVSNFGYKISLVSYTTPSANLMLREIGIVLFLASVGIKAGDQFIPTLVSGEGFVWMGYGAIITLTPLVLVGFFARKRMKMNYIEICGLLAGSTTDPPALAYANSIATTDAPSITYATVYPLTMFLRILVAQMLIILFV
ncbi:MAG TPA: putative transporter [Bacteroidales bacterium]|nr:putative transporter [Bacteroidales bacterium]HNS45803.1 putative transporter [Bacteroidales bacterium]